MSQKTMKFFNCPVCLETRRTETIKVTKNEVSRVCCGVLSKIEYGTWDGKHARPNFVGDSSRRSTPRNYAHRPAQQNLAGDSRRPTRPTHNCNHCARPPSNSGCTRSLIKQPGQLTIEDKLRLIIIEIARVNATLEAAQRNAT